MRQALRKVGGIRDEADIAPAIAQRVREVPRGLDGPIGNKIREAIVRRVGKPLETDQPEVSFPHVAIPERKERKEIRILKQRVAEIEREMASVKQVTDQLR